MKKVKIDTTKISNIDKRLLASSIIEGVQKHFESQENCKRFEEWKQKKGVNSF